MTEETGKDIPDPRRNGHGVHPDVVRCGTGSQVAEGVDDQQHSEVQTNSVDVEDVFDQVRNLMTSSILPLAWGHLSEPGQPLDCEPVLLGPVEHPIVELGV